MFILNKIKNQFVFQVKYITPKTKYCIIQDNRCMLMDFTKYLMIKTKTKLYLNLQQKII